MKVDRRLLAVFGLTGMLSGWSVWHAPGKPVVAPVERGAMASSTASAGLDTKAGHAGRLPMAWEAPRFEAPRRDPFADKPLPSPTAANAVPDTRAVAPAQPVMEAVAAPPQPPQMGYRFAGVFSGPDGKRHVYIAQGDNIVAAEPGLVLSEGYVVEALAAQQVQLVYPPLQYKVAIPIPASPSTF